MQIVDNFSRMPQDTRVVYFLLATIEFTKVAPDSGARASLTRGTYRQREQNRCNCRVSV